MLQQSVLYAVAGLFLLFLVALAAGPNGGPLALLLALGAVLLVWLGPERLGIGLLGLAFFLAPGGIGPSFQVAGPSVLFTDLALIGGAVLLLPRFLQGRFRLSLPFVSGVALIVFSGMLATLLVAEDPGSSTKTLVGFLYCILLIPLLLVGLHPSRRLVRGLAWAYVTGHLLDVLYSVAQDPTTSVRHAGLTQHPNGFGEAGLMAFALLLYLLPHSSRRRLVYAAMAVCLVSVYISGSRGATLAVALLILAVPLVERTAWVGVLMGFLLSAATVVLYFLAQNASADSSLGRLTGAEGTAAASDEAREQSLAEGWSRFLDHPITGEGYHAELGLIHNLLLEIAVASGIVGAVGFVVYLWAAGRPLLGRSSDRRLAYTVPAYAMFCSLAPAFTDRAALLPIALAVSVFRGYTDPPDRHDEEPAPLDEKRAASRRLRAMPGVTR